MMTADGSGGTGAGIDTGTGGGRLLGTGGTASGGTGSVAGGSGGAPVGGTGGLPGAGGALGTGGNPGSVGVAALATGGTGVGGSGAGAGGNLAMAGNPGAAGSAAGGAPPPRIISIDFVGAAPVPMGPTEVAGIKPAANWNSAPGATGTLSTLVDQFGAVVPGLVVKWTSQGGGVFSLWTVDRPGDARMFNGYLDPIGAPAMIQIQGVPDAASAARFDMYLYAMGSIAMAGNDRTSTYAIPSIQLGLSQRSPSPATAADLPVYMKATNGGFGNYVQFARVSGTAFTILATPGTGLITRAPVNGLQIVLPPGT